MYKTSTKKARRTAVAPKVVRRRTVPRDWRTSILRRSAVDIADVDESVWKYIAARGGHPNWRTACASAAKKFTTAARAGGALVTELRVGGDHAGELRISLHDAVQEALRDGAALVGLIVHRIGLTLSDLLPGSLSSNTDDFQRLADTHARVARMYKAMAGPKRAANRPALVERNEMMTAARERGVGPWAVATQLAQLGIPATNDEPGYPLPTDKEESPQRKQARELLKALRNPTEAEFTATEQSLATAGRSDPYRFATKTDFIAARAKWVNRQTRKHCDLLKQVGRTKNTQRIKGGKVSRTV